LLLASLLIANASASGDFAARVKAGKDAIATAAGREYDRMLVPTLQAAVPRCIPQGSSGHIGKFTLVGSVSLGGAVSAIEVQPETVTSRCFALQIGGATLPPSPSSNYPLIIEMDVTP